MLHVQSAPEITSLAQHLAEMLATPLDDPMQPEWIAAPTLGMHRWLALELARRLGASSATAGDGVAANITFTLPGSLRQAVLEVDRLLDEANPWEIRHLVWTVLSVLHRSGDDDVLAPLTRIPDGSTWFGKARRIADLFDRYDLHRPELILHWSHGHDVDGMGQRLAPHALWQPRLWREVRSTIAVPSAAERLPGLIDRLRSGTLSVDLPPRLFVFGLTTLPGGQPYVELLTAIAASREVYLMMLDPSPEATTKVSNLARYSDPDNSHFRSDDNSELAIDHPLLRSWGRPYRERAVVLAVSGIAATELSDVISAPSRLSRDDSTLLRAIQLDLLEDRTPAQTFDLSARDHSVEIHAAFGAARQTDALRDALLRRLAADPSLREDDIVVLCPAIEQFTPHIEASFGPSVDAPSSSSSTATPRLRYRITDRSIRSVSPLIEAFDSVLAVIAGRASSTEVMELISLPPVRERFNFSDEDVATVRSWVVSAGTKWGFDGAHRAAWGLPEAVNSNTWRQLIDRLMYGIAVGDAEFHIGAGEIAPLHVESGDIPVAGALAHLIYQLSELRTTAVIRHTATEWADLLLCAAEAILATTSDDAYQFDQLRHILAALGTDVLDSVSALTLDLSLAEVRQAIAAGLEGTPGRPNFFRGGVTISSLTPLRWLPFRVICLLGLDEALLSGGTLETDDLIAVAPILGDRDPRAELRQSLLEAVIAASDDLVITHSGHSVLTNQRIPDAVALAEFKEVIEHTVSPETRRLIQDQVVVGHPRQADDERYFSPEALQRGVVRWSFDTDALQGARARLGPRSDESEFLAGALGEPDASTSSISLEDLHEFFRHPVRTFLRRRLRLHLAYEDPGLDNELDIEIDPLSLHGLGDRLLRARLSGIPTATWERHERARGSLPIGEFATPVFDELTSTVDDILDHVTSLGLDPTEHSRFPIDITLLDGTRILGAVLGHCGSIHPGPGVVTFNRFSASLQFSAWLNLVVLEASDPERTWRSAIASRGETSKLPPQGLELVPSSAAPNARQLLARDALQIVVDVYRRGMNEPLPLFPRLSSRLASGTATPKDWKDTIFGGPAPRRVNEGYDSANMKVFGDISFDELCDIAARESDPPGTESSRAKRYAEYLHGAVRKSGIHASEAVSP